MTHITMFSEAFNQGNEAFYENWVKNDVFSENNPYVYPTIEWQEYQAGWSFGYSMYYDNWEN